MQSKRQDLLAQTHTQGFVVAACALALYVLSKQQSSPQPYTVEPAGPVYRLLRKQP
jgi:hypothetical protein